MAGTRQKGASGGRRSLSVEQRKRFALRLYSMIGVRCGSFEAFKKRLLEKRAWVRESTVRGWLPPFERLAPDPVNGSKVLRRDWEALKTADLPGLQEVANLLDVSVDYLLGYPVPPRRSDREPTGELARSLVEYVARYYLEHAPHQRRDGLTEAVGGTLKHGASRRGRDLGAESGPRALEIEVGNPALLRPLLLVVEDAQAFLAQTAEWTFRRAERWEEEKKEPEREAVRDAVRRLAPHVEVLSRGIDRSPERVLNLLIDAALNPLDPVSQAWVTTLNREVRAEEESLESEAAATEQLAASISESTRS